ncbi:acyl-protein synthetase [Lasiosphaeria miniovina]|uniref:Acyl-protein synthetase n=1 Tax=Lasiosphaeria miniovina TaxID=1954250 RepID=A0AA40A0M4_9PEZI|nr:acyl-protein synthetase [Lasiosphaeria miniovina]KAK0707146.1 acyl-protein synthetase [Lasiosphaeria miniovina]
MVLQDLLRERAASGPSSGKLLLYPRSGTVPNKISYSALHAEASLRSDALRSLGGFHRASPVLLHLEDHWDAILWFWAVLLADGLPVLSSPFSNVDEHRLQHIQGLAVLLQSPLCITRARALPLTYGNKKVNGINGVNGVNGTNGIGDSNGPDGHCAPPPGLAMLMLTSGSTGNAKAVQLTHAQVLAAVAGKASVRPLPASGTLLNWIGLDHVASLVEIHLQALWLGADQVHAYASDVVSEPVRFLDLLSEHRVARSFAPNFFLARLVGAVAAGTTDDEESGQQDKKRWDLSGLVALASGGEANDTATCVAAAALLSGLGAPPDVLTPGFGMTETCAGAIFNLACPAYEVEHDSAVAALGRCMPGIEMRITTTNPERRRVAVPGEVGDLEVRGPVVFKGYYRNAPASAAAFTPDGWFRTEDQAALDAGGNLRLAGRVKDVVNINGVKLLAADVQTAVERAVSGLAVARVVLFASRAPGMPTEQVTVAVVPRAWPTPTRERAAAEEAVVQACVLSTASRPLVFVLGEASVALLPTSALGKISRAKMRTLFEQGVFAADVELHAEALDELAAAKQREAAADTTPASEAETLLLQDIAAIAAGGSTAPPPTLSVDTPVFSLGFTSMDLIRLKHRLDTRLGISVPVITLMKHPTARLDSTYDPVATLDSTYDPVATLDSMYDPVVTLAATGHRTPLWLVHPGVGEVLVFLNLSVRMGALERHSRPTYALRARGFEPGQSSFGSIGEAVETYVGAVRRVQPRGPYALAGYSFGTMLAFEMAKVLTGPRFGDEVRFVGSLNLPPHIKHRMRQLSWNMCLLHLAYFLGLTTEERADAAEADSDDGSRFRGLSRAAALEQVVAEAGAPKLAELGLTRDALARWADVAFGLQSMAVDYEPLGSVAALDVFYAIPLRAVAKSREEWLAVHLARWADFCTEKVRFHPVAGEHYTMIGPDHVDTFAHTLAAALAARGL